MRICLSSYLAVPRTQQDLRGQVVGCATQSVGAFVVGQVLGEAEVRDLHVAYLVLHAGTTIKSAAGKEMAISGEQRNGQQWWRAS
jgi:hypothetical protein